MTRAHSARRATARPFPSRRFRAVTLTPRGPELRERDLRRTLREDALVVRPLVAGICRSDLKEVAGTRAGRSDFGHELVGIVEWADTGAPLGPGDLVCLDPNVDVSRTSGFAELLAAEGTAAALERAFPRAPAGVPARTLLFTEPLACAIHCVRRAAAALAGGLDGARLGVLGAGIAGTLIALYARRRGARVTVFNRSPDRLEFVRATGLLGASELRADDAARADELDVAVVATSFVEPEGLARALRATRGGGAVVLYGGTRPGARGFPLDVDALRRRQERAHVRHGGKRVVVVGSYGADDADFERASAVLERGGRDFAVERLVAGEVPLARLPHALRSLARERVVGKIVVVPGPSAS